VTVAPRASSQPAAGERLAAALRAVGIMAMSGSDSESGRVQGAQEWLISILGTPAIGSAIKHATETGDLVDLIPGLFMLRYRSGARRRQSVAEYLLLPTAELVNSEMLHHLCRDAMVDFELVSRRLSALNLPSAVEVTRTAPLVLALQESEQRRLEAESALESIGRELAESYEELTLLYNTVRNMSAVERPERFVESVCADLYATLSFEWIAVCFGPDLRRLPSLSGQFFKAGGLAGPRLAAVRRSVDEIMPSLDGDRPEVTNAGDCGPLADLGNASIVSAIVGADGSKLGAFVAGEKKDGSFVSSADLKLVGASATQTAIFIENAALYDELHAMLLGTLEALTASIDAKDPYTSGHSKRVAHLTAELARAAGLDERMVNRFWIAGLVHDVGKIGVPEAVLLKAGRLDDSEMALVRRHPEIGYRILRDIPNFGDIIPGVLHHHERWDGAGYPTGLRGEEIPLVARLIAIADTFDAISSTRTYRVKRERRDALAEVRRSAGSQFDPHLVPLFEQLDFREFDAMLLAQCSVPTQPGANP